MYVLCTYEQIRGVNTLQAAVDLCLYIDLAEVTVPVVFANEFSISVASYTTNRNSYNRLHLKNSVCIIQAYHWVGNLKVSLRLTVLKPWFFTDPPSTPLPQTTTTTAASACAPNPCLNGGHCSDINGGFECLCSAQFFHPLCSKGEFVRNCE